MEIYRSIYFGMKTQNAKPARKHPTNILTGQIQKLAGGQFVDGEIKVLRERLKQLQDVNLKKKDLFKKHTENMPKEKALQERKLRNKERKAEENILKQALQKKEKELREYQAELKRINAENQKVEALRNPIPAENPVGQKTIRDHLDAVKSIIDKHKNPIHKASDIDNNLFNKKTGDKYNRLKGKDHFEV